MNGCKYCGKYATNNSKKIIVNVYKSLYPFFRNDVNSAALVCFVLPLTITNDTFVMVDLGDLRSKLSRVSQI